ncbi:MAG: PTS transporter subunit EIIB [Actinomycetaceae bacterium]|nr:PTS transporter subunit EIIB [Actinomycetaceae bacterium]
MTAAQNLVDALGGVDNIIELEPCMMRIRAIVRDPLAVNEEAIRATNPLAVVCSGQYVQIIVGPQSDEIVSHMLEIVEAEDVNRPTEEDKSKSAG